MRTLIVTIALALLPVWAFAAPTVSLRANASVQPGFFLLSDVADIKDADKEMRSKLSAASMGRSPLSGTSRALTQGDVALKLRQAGIDPKGVSIGGAPSVAITVAGDVQSDSVSSGVKTAGPAPLVIHPGDTVNVTIVDGPVTITTQATALGGGGVGDRVRLDRPGSAHPLTGTVIDSQNVRVED